jgi:hypothetical protein
VFVAAAADARSKYATSVGATQGPEAGQPEIACSSATGGLITTGGGFSTYVKRPDWQDAAVHAYLNGPTTCPRAPCSPPRDAPTRILPPWATT